MLEGEHVVDRDACARCFVCTEECYARALEVVGREVTVGEVLDEVLRDLPFYETSGGGMTVSGGEPLMQSAFTTALLAEAKAAGLHNCLETCGAYPAGVGLAVLPYVDQVLFDYKETDPEKHKAFTGRDNRQILENLRAMDRAGAEIVLRCPIVPGFNLRDEHLEGIARTAASLAHCAGVHVMGYHRLGAGKRKRFGMDELSGPLCEQPSMTDAEVESVIQRVRSFGYENVSRS
jgi:pyruvate formate lyase activating enzyme